MMISHIVFILFALFDPSHIVFMDFKLFHMVKNLLLKKSFVFDDYYGASTEEKSAFVGIVFGVLPYTIAITS